MRTRLGKIYQCEHCDRQSISGGFISRHEKFCRLNPINKHICFDYCRHLEKKTRAVGETYDGPDHYETDMICKAKNIKMYSYKFEKNMNFKLAYIKGLVRMPLDCDKYESFDYHEIDELHR